VLWDSTVKCIHLHLSNHVDDFALDIRVKQQNLVFNTIDARRRQKFGSRRNLRKFPQMTKRFIFQARIIYFFSFNYSYVLRRETHKKELEVKWFAMGLVHTPRTVYSILNGLYKRQLTLRQQRLIEQKIPAGTSDDVVKRQQTKNAFTIGIGTGNRHIYQARLGLFDIDYLGHMNNGACVCFRYALLVLFVNGANGVGAFDLRFLNHFLVRFFLLFSSSRIFDAC
jgi:hypothetical protein